MIRTGIAPVIVAPLPAMVIPPSTPPPAGAAFPRVVVVNPTPHPTPPATPIPIVPPPANFANQTHLVPPPRLPAAVRPVGTSTVATNGKGPRGHNAFIPEPVPQSRGTAPATAPARPASPKRSDDSTLKPSDRRFFLQQDQSPSPERDSHDLGSQGSPSTGKTPSDAGELDLQPSPSSVASNQTKASTSSKRQRGRKIKEAARHAPARPAMHRFQSSRNAAHPLVQRKAAGGEESKGRATFKLGPHTASPVSMERSEAGPSRQATEEVDYRQPGPSKVPVPAKPADVLASPVVPLQRQPQKQPQQPPPPEPAQPPPRRGIVVEGSSSECESTDTEEDSWESEELSGEDEERVQEDSRIREAALEAQRQRALFVKQPQRSYSNLNRTQSGLLSALLNPDPSVLPAPHQYRAPSSQDVRQVQPIQPVVHQRSLSGPIPASLTTSRSSAALPMATQVTAQAPSTNGAPRTNSNGAPRTSSNGPYRPRAPPQGQEMEDDSDSDDENADDGIQVSRSLAQQKLAALADPNRRRNSDRGHTSEPPMRPTLTTVATAPIPLNHPWNLPAPAPPSTPRTTRRQMLATELSESLRRNLLWERQVSKMNWVGRRQPTLLGNGLRPLTSTTTVQAQAQAAPPEGVRSAEMERQRERDRSQRGGDRRSGDEANETEDKRRRAMARNRSWADDYHYSGW